MERAAHGRTVSYEDLKLMGLGKAVDEYARISHRRSRSSSRLNTERYRGTTSATEVDVADTVDVLEVTDGNDVWNTGQDAGRHPGRHAGRHPGRHASDAPAAPRTHPALSSACLCLRGACACVLLRPLPRILFDEKIWRMGIALAVPLLIHWCLSRCSMTRCLVSCAAIVVLAKGSKCLWCHGASLDGQPADVLASLRRSFPELTMTDRKTEVAADGIQELYHAEDRSAFRREQEVMMHVERLTAWYGLKEARVRSLTDAYERISKLACEMHLERRHRRVGSLDEALVAIDLIARHLGNA